MLIDTFANDLQGVLEARIASLGSSCHLYLLVDGAFVPGLHKMLEPGSKALLFESLPTCSDEARAVSPFLTRFKPGDKKIDALFRRCNRWPMLSAIYTRESLSALADRLASWCIVEADGQRFNFRLSDTRRLPAISKILSTPQRASFVGPAVAWSYMSREGRWCDLELDGVSAEIAVAPVLDQRQFAALVEDSRIDEMLVQLSDRGNATYRHPSRSHALLNLALQAAAATKLHDEYVLDWSEWFWQHDQLHDLSKAIRSLETWRAASP